MGSMSLRRRMEALDAFKEDEHVPVFLLNKQCGAVGLNLTIATHIMILEYVIDILLWMKLYDNIPLTSHVVQIKLESSVGGAGHQPCSSHGSERADPGHPVPGRG